MTPSPPAPGIPEYVAPGVRRILAPNASPMTHWGTNTYLVGETEVAVIDPGPRIADHVDAILRATGSGTITTILVTHAHRDHSGGAAWLSEATGAPVLGFGPATAGRSPRMAALAGHPALGGGEGLDDEFAPSGTLTDGDRIGLRGHAIEVLRTPGHFSGHLSFSVDDVLFSGDLVMGWSTTLISPPDGDVADFMSSCNRLLRRTERLYLPGHGAPVERPHARVEWLMAHRRQREAQILETLSRGKATPEDLAAAIYSDVPAIYLPAAARNVLAHLIDLTDRAMVVAHGTPGPGTTFDLS